MAVWQHTAFIFPGQGSQMVGMGKDLAAAYPVAQDTFSQADDLLGFALSDLCFNGPVEQLDDTINTQPALYVCSMAILNVLRSEYPAAVPGYVAGHSLGELTALTAAGALSFEDGLSLVRERGRLMKEAGEKNPGAMAALLGVERDTAEQICKEAADQSGKPIVVANDNCPGQIVISGDKDALELALQLASEQGARRAVPLAVSIAAHSPLMQPAADQFSALLDATTFHPPQIPVYSNATASLMDDVDAIRSALNRQLTSPVRWTESIQAMIDAGASRFIEIGSGDVLTGMVKRIDRQSTRVTLNSTESLRAFIASESE